MGLRDEKKRATRTAIADAALALFLERGFDRVTVAEVAGSAQVSVNTVFNYFPAKEDLFFDRQDEVVNRLRTAVTRRQDDETPAAALLRAFLESLDRNDPTLGLHPGAADFWRVVEESPALQARARLLQELTENALAEALIARPGRATPSPSGESLPPPDSLPATPGSAPKTAHNLPSQAGHALIATADGDPDAAANDGEPNAVASGDPDAGVGGDPDVGVGGDSDAARVAAAVLAAADRALHSEIRRRVRRGERVADIRVAVQVTAEKLYIGLDHLP